MNSIIQVKIESISKAAKINAKTDIMAAIKQYYQILFLNKNHIQTYQDLAQLYLQISDYSAAISCLQQCQTLKYDILIEDELLNILYLKGVSLLEQGDINNFLEMTDYEQFGNYLDFGNLQLMKPYAYIMTNHLKYAMIEVQKAIKADSNNVEAILLRAKLNWVQGKQVDGNMDYWLVHSMQPDLQEIKEFMLFITPKVNALIAESKQSIVQRDLEKCKLSVKKGLELFPNNVELLQIRAYLHRTAHEYEQSLKDLDRALQHDRNNKDINDQIALTYNEMAMLLFSRQNHEDALTLFHEAIKYKPNDWGILANRGDTYRNLGNLNEAINDYRNAKNIQSSPEIDMRLALIMHTLAVDLFNKKKYQQCLEQLNQALELAESTELYMKRGKCLLQLQKRLYNQNPTTLKLK